MKNIIIIIVIITAGYFIFSGTKDEKWTGFFYPDASDLSKWITSPVFEDIESCRDWAHSQESYALADYECGLNCEYEPQYKVNICEETIQ